MIKNNLIVMHICIYKIYVQWLFNIFYLIHFFLSIAKYSNDSERV